MVEFALINTPAAAAALVASAGIVDHGAVVAVFLSDHGYALNTVKLEKRRDGQLADLMRPLRQGLRSGAAGFLLVCDTRATAEAASESIAGLRRLSSEYDLQLLDVVDMSNGAVVSKHRRVFRAANGSSRFEEET